MLINSISSTKALTFYGEMDSRMISCIQKMIPYHVIFAVLRFATRWMDWMNQFLGFRICKPWEAANHPKRHHLILMYQEAGKGRSQRVVVIPTLVQIMHKKPEEAPLSCNSSHEAVECWKKLSLGSQNVKLAKVFHHFGRWWFSA